MELLKFYIYVYLDPRKNPPEVFYVGKGKNNRDLVHLSEARNNVHHPKCYRIKSIWKVGLEPVIERIYYTQDENEAYEFEEFLIEEIGTNFVEHLNDGPLCNMCPGGKGGRAGMVTVKDKNGVTSSVSATDPRYLSGELKGHTTGMVIVKDKNGENFQVSVDDPQYLSGEIQHVNKGKEINKGMVSVIKNGIKTKIPQEEFDNDDTIVGHTKGMVPSKIVKTGEHIQASIDDKRFERGEIVALSKGRNHRETATTGKHAKNRHHMTKDGFNKMVKTYEINHYLWNGWKFGRTMKKYRKRKNNGYKRN